MKAKVKSQNFSQKVLKRNAEGGFSLIEVMVAMIIFLIVTGSIYGLLQVGRLDRNRSSRRNDMLKNARLAVHLIGRDILNAGLRYNRTGGSAPDDFLSDTLEVLPASTNSNKVTSIVGGDNLTTTSNLPGTDVIGFCSRDMTFNDGNALEILTINPPLGGTPILTVEAPTPPTTLNLYDLYLLESDKSQAVVMATAINGTNITLNNTDPLGMNVPKCDGAAGPGCRIYDHRTLKKITLVTYKVNQDGVLVRTFYGNDAADLDGRVEQFLAYNVQDLQINYVMRDGRVTADPFLGPDGVPGGGNDGAHNFNSIRQVSVTMQVQATEADEQMQQPETITLNSTFSARNMEYDAG